ncbi:MAG: hypothetical protein GC158_13880 [Cyanobacteria bacterium RI_101]|nr:hypothetical protein [Cyanobacteria bacterium RI_101]
MAGSPVAWRALASFWRRLSPSQGELLTSAAETEPTAAAIADCLEAPIQFCFFQGYSAQIWGQDYLLPQEAEPDYLATTAIPLGWLLRRLNASASAQALLLLDLTPIGPGHPLSGRGLWLAKQCGVNLVAHINRPPGTQGRLASAFLDSCRRLGKAVSLEDLERQLRGQSWDGAEGEKLVVISGRPWDYRLPLFPGLNAVVNSTAPFFSPGPLRLAGFFLFLASLGLVAGVVLSSRSPAPPSPAEKQARQSLQWQQASAFVEAIAVLRRVPPQSPDYAQAQSQIRRWSEIIWEIAQGRAEAGNWRDAVAAAQLVPRDQGALYQAAQDALRRWRGGD